VSHLFTRRKGTSTGLQGFRFLPTRQRKSWNRRRVTSKAPLLNPRLSNLPTARSTIVRLIRSNSTMGLIRSLSYRPRASMGWNSPGWEAFTSPSQPGILLSYANTTTNPTPCISWSGHHWRSRNGIQAILPRERLSV